ncbi:hypothetical protein F4804DRAFT_260225 [Jackrogersella minutella]|nr:hypothetical protein F4804DRAFT_260225 [Jackrogersella minutella]
MATTKRQKWVDIYDPVTGQHIPSDQTPPVKASSTSQDSTTELSLADKSLHRAVATTKRHKSIDVYDPATSQHKPLPTVKSPSSDKASTTKPASTNQVLDGVDIDRSQTDGNCSFDTAVSSGNNLDRGIMKRQKWIDVYDPATGQHVPLPTNRSQSSDQASTTKLVSVDHSQSNGNHSIDAVEPNGSNLYCVVKASESATTEKVSEHFSCPQEDTGANGSLKVKTSNVENDGSSTLEVTSENSNALEKSKVPSPPSVHPAATLVDVAGVCPPPNSAEQSDKISNSHDPNGDKIITENPWDQKESAGEDFRSANPKDIWTNEDWDRTPYDRKSYDDWGDLEEDSDHPFPFSSYCEYYIMDWIKTTHEVVVDLFPKGVKEPFRCDINTKTGTLMDPVQYPRTSRAKGNINGPPDERETAVGEEQKQQRDNPREIRVPCYLRPAITKDMEQIVSLYNTEVESSNKLLDTKPLNLVKFVGFFQSNCANKIPFIVAIEGWHDVYNQEERVVGFAWTDVRSKGLFGSYDTHAALCGNVTAVVHPDFRRQNICSAMLDALFYCCSSNYTARLGYQMVNAGNDHRLMTPNHNPRQWNSLDIDVVIPSGTGDESSKDSDYFKWVSNYLEKYFQMQVVYHDEKLFRDNRGDKPMWLDKFTFRHQCRPSEL